MRENSYFKRSLAIIMAIIMVFTYMPAMVWADETGAATKVNTVEDFAGMNPSSVFNALKGKVTVEYSHNASFKGEDGKEFVDDAEKGALKSNSMTMANSEIAVNIKVNDGVKASKLYFDYEVSGEGSSTVYDGLQVNGGKKIGTTDGFVTHEMQVKGGGSVKIAYVKD